MAFCKLPCARPAYRQAPYPVRRWIGTGHPTYDPPSDPRWKAIPVYHYNVCPPAPVCVPAPVPVYIPAPVPVCVPTPVYMPTPVVPCKIEPVYPFLQANKFDLFNPPTRTKLPHYHFPKVCQPQAHYYPPPYQPPYPPPQVPYWMSHPPPFPRNSANKPELHPMLALHERSESGPNIRWLLSDDPFHYITWDNDCPLPDRDREKITLYQEAAYPSSDVDNIRINYSEHSYNPLGFVGRKFVDFLIPRRNPCLPLTVGDVLQGIFSHFMTPLSPEDLQTLSNDKREEGMVYDAKYRRTHLRPGLSDTRDPIRRVDTLGDRTRFGGLRVHEVQNGTLVLNLNLLPGQTES